ncbi:MAG: metallophosphoesterase [Alphaproteobacteria bacterium]|nr:metallophosphoesterase [Alphaproteobacteria bacterium]
MISCAVTTSVLGCLATFFLFWRYAWFLDLTRQQKTGFFILFLLAGCIPALTSYQFESFLGRYFAAYRYSLYFLFVFCIILFSATVFRDIIWTAVYALGRLFKTTGIVSPFSKTTLIRLNDVLLVFSLVCTGWACYEGLRVPAVKTLEFASGKIKRPITLAVLSDLHIHRVISPDKIKGIVEKTNAENPDVVLLAGDIIDDEPGRVLKTAKLLQKLKASGGIYFVTGNHEFYAGYEPSVSLLKELGFSFLENSGTALQDQLYIAGIPDLFSASAHKLQIDPAAAFQNAAPDQFRLLMSHTPADFGKNNAFDLEVSGHTHGGQIFPFHIFTKLYNKYLAGLYETDNDAAIYVSRGSGQWGPQMRFLAPAEITILKLVPEKLRF